MTEGILTGRVEKLEKQLDNLHLGMANVLEENNKIMKDILNHQNNERQTELYTELEIARTIISKVVKTKNRNGKNIEEPEEEIRIEEIITKLQEIIVKIEKKRYITIEDLENHRTSNTKGLTIRAPYRLT